MLKRHRYERSENKLGRKRPRRNLLDRILIVCEGEKTEVNYFTAIRRELRVPGSDLAIFHSEYGTEPIQIVEFAKDKFNESRAFERIYVVFDRDDHHTYHQALARAEALNNKMKNDNGKRASFIAIPSVPNFELWILLHFRNVFEFIGRADLQKELKKPDHYPTYAKNCKSVYSETKSRLPEATKRAQKIRETCGAHSGVDCYTDADTLCAKMLTYQDRLKR